MEQKTIISIIKELKKYTPQENDVEILLCHALSIDKMTLYSDPNKKISEDKYLEIQNLIERRRKNEPTWQIVGMAPFWNLEFYVSKNVLTPRKETEFLIEEVLKTYEKQREKTLFALELGSGSGNISLTLAKEIPNLNIISFDKSKEAISIAKKNQKKLNIKNVEFIHSSNFSFIKNSTFDFFFSNPPYVKKDEIKKLQKEITEFEPFIALDGGIDGLDFYRLIAKNIRRFLAQEGHVFLEIGHDQKDIVEEIFLSKGFSLKLCKKDYSGLDRIVVFT